MMLVFPFCGGDLVIARAWLRWVARLGGCPGHKAICVIDPAVNSEEALKLVESAGECFDSVEVICPSHSVTGWPAGPNLMFSTAAQYVQERRPSPWLWCEPDAIPLKAEWLGAIEVAYRNCGCKFMGAIVPCKNPVLPKEHLNGNAVYPSDAFSILRPYLQGNAWDVASAPCVVPQAANTPAIQHFYGEERLAPTFLAQKSDGCPINAFTLDALRPEAVLFHRNKDGTLIRLLWQNFFPEDRSRDEFIVVLPFCNADAGIAIKNARWMAALSGARRFDCLLSYDSGTIKQYVAEMKNAASEVFHSVQMFRYPVPAKGGWPAAPNWAFQCTARHIQSALRRPWLWLEADAIPVKPDWIERLQQDYQACGRSFYGPIVPGMGHMNGVGIYPADAATRLPTGMRATDLAWDSISRKDMGDDVYDGGILIQHLWGIWKGRPHINSGPPPSFRTAKDLAMLNPEAVILHRCKDGSLIDRLASLK